MCKNQECGFDAGDCGVEDIFGSMHGVEVTWNTLHVDLPPGIPSVYFNLSVIVQGGTITDGSHDNAELVRTATISQKHKIMTLTFHRNISRQEVVLSITTEHNEGANKTTVEKTFNITVDTTIVIPTNESNATSGDTQSTGHAIPSVLPPVPHTPTFGSVSTVTPAISEYTAIPTHVVHTSTPSSSSIATATPTIDNISATAPRLRPGFTPNPKEQNATSEKLSLKSAIGSLTEEKANEQKIQLLASIDENSTKIVQPETNDQGPRVSSDLLHRGNVTAEGEPAVDALLIEQRPVNDGSKVTNDGGAEEPHSGTGESTKEISSDPLLLPLAPNPQQSSGGGVRKLLSISVDGTESLGIFRLREEIAARKAEQLKQLELDRERDMERERLLRINRDYEELLSKEADKAGQQGLWPWERQNRLDSVREMRGGGRRLLDMYGDSLKHVNKLFNHAFGPSARKVPAHMPHMIDKSIMEELQARWPEEWEQTSSHSLRHPQDMQYAFAYFYYLIHAKVDYNVSDIWTKELDVDGDGKLNDNELRTLGVHLYGAPLSTTAFAELKEKLVNTCLTLRPDLQHQHIVEVDKASSHAAPVECPITVEVAEACNKTSDEMRKVFSKRLKYKHQLDGTDEVAFIMVSNNDTVMQGKLDGIRQKRHKFICLNDNINHSSPDAGKVVYVLHDFYMSILPMPSRFELPSNVHNTYAYIDELRSAQMAATRKKQYTIVVGFLSVFTLLFILWKCYAYASRADRRTRERRATRFLNT
jgi:UDP-N-acetylglucosamine-lysosomal-enzyme